jgi:hypothetical protein
MPKRTLLVVVSVIVVAGAGLAVFLSSSEPSERAPDSERSQSPTEFEAAVLAWVAAHSGDVELAAQLAHVRVSARQHTGVGCYSDFAVPGDAPASTRPYASHGPLEGPDFKSPTLKYGGGTLLWFAAGHAQTLEIYTFDDVFPVDHAELGAFELGSTNDDAK